MRIALTGGSGILGQVVQQHARARGYEVVTFGRSGDRRWLLGQRPDLEGFDALVHAAFQHAPGRYRGGEGDDPAGFVSANLDGTLALWEASRHLDRRLFISSRAVFDAMADGLTLYEDMPARPRSLYGQVKAGAEAALIAQGGAVLRATGLYGAGAAAEKWRPLFEAAAAGHAPPARRATEVLVDDVAAAILLILETGAKGCFHASDILLDRRDLLAAWGEGRGLDVALPAPDPAQPSVLDCSRLRALGWAPSGWSGLGAVLSGL